MSRWISPTNYSDPSSDWANQWRSYNGDTALYASSINQMQKYTSLDWLVLTVDSVACDKVRVFLSSQGGSDPVNHYVHVEVYYGGGWHSLGGGNIFYTDSDWTEISIGSIEQVTGVRIIMYNWHWSLEYQYIHEVEFHKVTAARSLVGGSLANGSPLTGKGLL